MQQCDVYWNGRYFFRLYRTPAEYKMRPYSKLKYPSSSFSAGVKGSLKLSLSFALVPSPNS